MPSPDSSAVPPVAKGRGSALKPPNRFVPLHVEDDFEHLEGDEGFLHRLERLPTEYFPDDSQSIVTENDSPDVGFRYSLNPYRGCSHGCSYCYARPTHEYFGLNAGLDFETKVFVKQRAAELFRRWLGRPRWRGDVICFSGVTDCYQPAEREFRITRACLEVAREAAQPVSIVTKNALVTRDLDLLREMARKNTAHVSVSVTTLDDALARRMEPRTSPPSRRLRAIGELSQAGVPTRVMVAPVIPGLNDSEIPGILKAAAEAGAGSATYMVLRLPMTVRSVFLEWLQRAEPLRQAKVEASIRATREGRLNDSQFGRRMRGSGQLAEQIKRTFEVFAKKHGLDQPLPELDSSLFDRPERVPGQLRLF